MQLLRRLTILVSLLFLTACPAPPTPPPPPPPSLSLSLLRLGQGETLTATVTGIRTATATVTVGGLNATIISRSPTSIIFSLPPALPAGMQPVVVQDGSVTLSGNLEVFGNIVPNSLVGLLKEGDDPADVTLYLENLGLVVLNNNSLDAIGGNPGTDYGICSSILFDIEDPRRRPIGELLAQLEKDDVFMQLAPQSLWGFGSAQPLEAIGAGVARARGRSGAGVTIAVLDSGVSPHSELGSRLLTGYSFVKNSSDTDDDFVETIGSITRIGHGTPIAVLAAGTTRGVAPAAEVLPVQVCDENGQCRASHVVRGICYALTQKSADRLVINLSLGGNTHVGLLEDVLEYVLDEGVLVAAAGGNQGSAAASDPVHYPAAYSLSLPGLVAVGALEFSDAGGGVWRRASFSTRGTHLTLSAPGVAVPIGNTLEESFTGTSFSTPLVAGALALWREAQPTMTSAQIRAALAAASTPLSQGAEEVGAGMLNLNEVP